MMMQRGDIDTRYVLYALLRMPSMRAQHHTLQPWECTAAAAVGRCHYRYSASAAVHATVTWALQALLRHLQVVLWRCQRCCGTAVAAEHVALPWLCKRCCCAHQEVVARRYHCDVVVLPAIKKKMTGTLYVVLVESQAVWNNHAGTTAAVRPHLNCQTADVQSLPKRQPCTANTAGECCVLDCFQLVSCQQFAVLVPQQQLQQQRTGCSQAEP